MALLGVQPLRLLHRAYALHRRQAVAVLSRINCKDKLLKTVLLPKSIVCNFQYYTALQYERIWVIRIRLKGTSFLILPVKKKVNWFVEETTYTSQSSSWSAFPSDGCCHFDASVHCWINAIPHFMSSRSYLPNLPGNCSNITQAEERINQT